MTIEEEELYMNYTRRKKENKKFGLFLNTIIDDLDFKMSHKTYERILECGNYLVFKSDKDLSNFKLHSANFCGNRFCPFCTYLKSIKDFITNYNLLMHCINNGKYGFLFLTLTSVNCEIDSLYEEITKYYKAFQRFIKRKEVASVVNGYIRKLEITYNEKSRTFHPHYHLILLVNNSYFNSRYYISRNRFLEIWSNSFRDNRITQLDVRRIKVNDLLNSTLELSKYVSKFNNIYNDSFVFKNYYKGLKNRQLISYGGLFKDYLKKYKSDEFEYYLDKDDIDYIYLVFSKWLGDYYERYKIVEF